MNIDQEIDNRIDMALWGLRLEAQWVGVPPNLWGVAIRLKRNDCVISEACINLFDEKDNEN